MIGNSAKVQARPVVQAAEFLRWLHDGEPFEACIIGPKSPTSSLWEGRANGKSTVAGWFTDAELAAKLACQVEAKGVYVTLNPVNDALLSRAESRFKAGVDRTADKSISKIRNLLIDLDPKRESGVSSTDPEHQAALEMARGIMADLTSDGWPDALSGDSGNGAHLLYPVDLPNNEESKNLVKAVLVALAHRYADQLARLNLEIDQAVFNPARLTKLYGTWTRKGDDTQARPHRLSRVIHFPGRQPVPLDLLKKLAATVPILETAPTAKSEPPDGGALDVGAYLQHYGQPVVKVKDHAGGQLHCLEHCLFNPEHKNEAAIGQAPDGKLFYQCFHNSCKGRTWAQAREIISGNDKLTQFMVGGAPPVNAFKRSYSLNKGVVEKVENALKNSDLTDAEITHVLNLIAKPESSLPIAQQIREWVLTSSGFFLTCDCFRELGLTSRDFQKAATLELLKLKTKGVIEKCGEKRGCYRRIERESTELDFKAADCSTIFNLTWPGPFHLEREVNLYGKNLVVLAGSTNAGKTALLLNLVRLNMAGHKINYFSSEMGAEELRLRLQKFDGPLVNDWTFKAYERAANFKDAIIPDQVNIIDFIEISDAFYKIGGELKGIFDKLTTGIAIIALQKAQGAAVGRGGDFSMEKARLYLSMDSGQLTIVKGKNWAQPGHNPNGKIFKFKLVDGCKFVEG